MSCITPGVLLVGSLPDVSTDCLGYAVIAVSSLPRPSVDNPIQLSAPTALLCRVCERRRLTADWIVLSVSALQAAYQKQAFSIRPMPGNPNLQKGAVPPTGLHLKQFETRLQFVTENLRVLVEAIDGIQPIKAFNLILSSARKNPTEWRKTFGEYLAYGKHERALWPRLDRCGPSSETGFRFSSSDAKAQRACADDDSAAGETQPDGRRSMSRELQRIALETAALYMGPHLTWEDLCAFFHRRAGITNRDGFVIDRTHYVSVNAFRKFIRRVVHPLWLKARREGSYAYEMYLAGRDRRGPVHLHCLGEAGQIDGYAFKRKVKGPGGEMIELTIAIIICAFTSYILSFGIVAGAETETVFAQALANCLRPPEDVCMDYGYVLAPGEWEFVGLPREIQGDGKLRITDVIADTFTSILFLSVTPPGKPHHNGSAEGVHSRGRKKSRDGKRNVGAAPDQHPIELHEAIHEEIEAILKHNQDCDISKRLPPDYIGRIDLHTPHHFVRALKEEGRVMSVTQPLSSVVDVAYSKQEAKLTRNGLTVKKLTYRIEDVEICDALELAYIGGLRELDVYHPPLVVRSVIVPLPDGRTVTAWLDEGANTESWAGHTFDSVEKKREAQREADREKEVHNAPHRQQQAVRRERAQGGRRGSKSATAAARKRRKASADLNEGLGGEA